MPRSKRLQVLPADGRLPLRVRDASGRLDEFPSPQNQRVDRNRSGYTCAQISATSSGGQDLNRSGDQIQECAERARVAGERAIGMRRRPNHGTEPSGSQSLQAAPTQSPLSVSMLQPKRVQTIRSQPNVSMSTSCGRQGSACHALQSMVMTRAIFNMKRVVMEIVDRG